MRSTVRLTSLALGTVLAATSLGIAQSGTRQPEPPARPAQAQETDGSATRHSPRAVVHASAAEVQPLRNGDAIPAVVGLRDANGRSVALADATRGESAVIVFYRGGWCPYCSVHLADLARIQPVLHAKGIPLIAISPDSPETLAKYRQENPLPYTLLSDSTHEAMKAFGIAFRVDDAMLERLKGHGMDIIKDSGNPDPVLPVPAVFVVNSQGRITFAHTDADYTKRLRGDEVLTAAGIAPGQDGSAPRQDDGSAPRPQEEGSESRHAPAPQNQGSAPR